jgi:hypothetical protein
MVGGEKRRCGEMDKTRLVLELKVSKPEKIKRWAVGTT